MVISLFKIARKYSAGVLRSKEAVTCLAEKTHVLDELHSGTGYSATGCEFNINESTAMY